MNPSLRKKLIAAFIAAGLSSTAAFVGYDLTLPSEGLSTKVYLDPVGLPTVCVGHMDKKLKVGSVYTLDQCMKMFAEDYAKHQKELDKVVKVPYASDWEREALTDFTFNNGIGNVESSTLIKLLNQGKHEQACAQLTRWVFAKGQKLKGLVTRRESTMPYCLGELSYDKQKAYEEFKKEYDEAKKANDNR